MQYKISLKRIDRVYVRLKVRDEKCNIYNYDEKYITETLKDIYRHLLNISSEIEGTNEEGTDEQGVLKARYKRYEVYNYKTDKDRLENYSVCEIKEIIKKEVEKIKQAIKDKEEELRNEEVEFCIEV